jgi:hypothetical protein
MAQPERPTFIATGETCRRLNVERSQLQNLFPLIPYLYVSKRETRLFIGEYIDGYATYLRERQARPTLATARAYLGTPNAQDIIRRVTTEFNQTLATKITFTPTELTKLLNIGRMTVTTWHQNKVFSVVRQEVRPKRDRGKETREVLLIPSGELRKALEWKIPRA